MDTYQFYVVLGGLLTLVGYTIYRMMTIKRRNRGR